MNRAIKLLLVVCLFAGSSGAQALPAGRESTTRWLLDAETGSDAGLGFKLPHLAFGTSIERTVGTRTEVQVGVSFSPDKKYVTNDGTSLQMKSMGLFWVTPRFAITGGLTRSNLWTSQFNKQALLPSVGIAVREHIEDLPGRVYISYLFPTGCQWGASCPIQSNRAMGPAVYWEQRVQQHFRLGLHMGYYRILNQGNPLQPSAGRTGGWQGDVHVVVRYELPGGALGKAY